MIPRRSARHLETALASCSRKPLSGRHRQYSAPSKAANAPAAALSLAPAPETYPDLMPGEGFQDMRTFLSNHSRMPKTRLPSPLPLGHSSETNAAVFPSSPTHNQLAIIDACLNDRFDVPRAMQIFSQMRSQGKGDMLLDSRLYTAFIEAYVDMAERLPEQREAWLNEAWSLYEALEEEREGVPPVVATYAVILSAWLRYGPRSAAPISAIPEDVTVASILSKLLRRQLSIHHVIASRALKDSEEAAALLKLLSSAAVELGHTALVKELGAIEQVGTHFSSPLDDVDEPMPTLRQVVVKDEEAGEERVIKEVPFNLGNLRKHLAEISLARRILTDDVTARQKLIEESVFDTAVARLRHDAETFQRLNLDSDRGLRRHDVRVWMWEWHQKLTAEIQEQVKDLLEYETNNKKLQRRPSLQTFVDVKLGPFVSLIKPEHLSIITIMEVMRLSGSGGVNHGMKTAFGLVTVGRAVEVEHMSRMCRKNDVEIPRPPHQREHAQAFTREGYKNLHARRVMARIYSEEMEEWRAEWTQVLRLKVGGFLVAALMKVATVERTAVHPKTGEIVKEEQPAFYHAYEYVRGQKLGVIRLNSEVSNRVAQDKVRDTLHPRHLPMVMPPKPWINYNDGGYLYHRAPVMRCKDSAEQNAYLKHATAAGNLELIFAGLDVLGSTPWRINRRIFDVVMKVWNSGKRLGKVPPAEYDKPVPEAPPGYLEDPRQKQRHQQHMRAYLNAKANNHSDRCNVNYKLEIARAMLEDNIYFPHNLDFRGRAYPLPPHLNHLGDDLSRGLLKFAEAKPLGERGMRWLKIHLAGLYGYDKASFDERVVWTDEHLNEVRDSAENPLEGRMWWMHADDPWQCLSACMELTSALDSPDPLAYMSTLPVHQDGTCNGLQHYAALGGDARGAAQVNLAAHDRPSDVYTYVASMTQDRVSEDVAAGNELAKLIDGQISRKVVKQTVMTTVYGVTFVGARDQIEKQVKDKTTVPLGMAWDVSTYLALKVLHSIGDLFSNATKIQAWLSLCAKLIARSIPESRVRRAIESKTSVQLKKRLRKEQMSSVIWTTPLGLPVVQPYRKENKKQFKTALQSCYLADPNSPAEVNSVKQASAFPPNFVHSLDATHMMLTSLECRRRDLTFAAVHDSYWTHASSIDSMNEIIRDTFISLHSSDVLMRLREEFRERYKDYKIPLADLTSKTIFKALATAGVKVPVTRAQADALPTLQPIFKITDKADASALTDENSRAVEVEPGNMDEFVLMGKFVSVADVFPPIPEKGSFDVSEIKKSQYFFS